jgi:hypothetical protein
MSDLMVCGVCGEEDKVATETCLDCIVEAEHKYEERIAALETAMYFLYQRSLRPNEELMKSLGLETEDGDQQ